MPTPNATYSMTARSFHWITAALVLTMVPAGFIMGLVGQGPLQDQLFHFHRGVGVVLAVLTLARLIYRLANPPPPLPALPGWQIMVSKAVHWAFYGLLLINPLVGWVGTSAYGAAIEVFGLFTVPAIIAQDKKLAEQIFEVHEAIGIAMAVLIAVHIAAALYHHFGRRDEVLRRMLPG